MINMRQDPTYAVLHRQALQSFDVICSDVENIHDKTIIRAILSKTAWFSNQALAEGVPDAQKYKQQFKDLLDEAPASFSMLAVFALIIELSAYLDKSLRKDDTDERRHLSSNCGLSN